MCVRSKCNWRASLWIPNQKNKIIGDQRVAYPEGQASLRVPDWKFWLDDFWKKSSLQLGDRTNFWRLSQRRRQVLVEMRCGAGTCEAPCILGNVLDSAFVQARVKLSCSDSLIYTLLDTFRRHVSPPRAAADVFTYFSTVPQGRFFLKIIQPNSSFGPPDGSLSSGVRNAQVI